MAEAVSRPRATPDAPTSSAIRFYFDLGSPYGYLGAIAVERMAPTIGRAVEWHPVLLGVTVLRVMGLKAVADTPLKREYATHDLPRCARLLGVPFVRAPTPPRSLLVMRAFTWLDAKDALLAARFARAAYAAQWGEGRDLADPAVLGEVAISLGIAPDTLLRAAAAEPAKALLRGRVNAAVAAGVFGVPTFVADGEMFWGADRIPMLEQWLRSGGW